MKLVTKFAKRIDSDSGYCNLTMAQDLEELAKKHYSKQLNMGSVGQSLIGEDIRNKLSPLKNMVAMVEAIQLDKIEKKQADLIKNEINNAKQSIDYLANLC